MSHPLHIPYEAEATMRNTFKFHIRHGSDQFQTGIGWLQIEKETIRLQLPTQSAEHIDTCPEIRNVHVCDTSKRLTETLRTRTLPVFKINFSRTPVFMAFGLAILMCPVPEALPWEWVFKGSALAGCFFILSLSRSRGFSLSLRTTVMSVVISKIEF